MAEPKTKAGPKVIEDLSGRNTEERLAATRFKQGGRTVFSVQMTPDQIINLIHRPNPEAANPGNRRIRAGHAAGFADYYLDNVKWVVPGIILRAPDIFKFEAGAVLPDESTSFGYLTYPKRMSGELQILDGQHRILGFNLALDKLGIQIEKAKDHRNRAIKQEGANSILAKNAAKELADLERKLNRFYNECVSVEIHVTDNMDDYRQLFFDIADNQLGITASVKARFDTRKPINRALPTVLEHPLLQNRVDIELDRIQAKNSQYLLTARHVIGIIRAAQVGQAGRVGVRVEKAMTDAEIIRSSLEYFDLLVESFPTYQAIIAAQFTPEQARTTTLLGSPAIMQVLAGTYWDLKKNHGFSNEMVSNYFKALAPHLVERAHANSIWRTEIDGDIFKEDAFGPNGHRVDLIRLQNILVDWAILGKKGAPFVFSKPQEAPPLPLTEEELQLAADIEADPELEKLLAEKEALETKAAKEGKIKR